MPALPPPDLTNRFAADLHRLGVDGMLALGVSGGPDSLALLLLAAAARPDRIIAATVDHGLRPEAAAEAVFVAEICAGLGVTHTTLAIEVADDPAGVQAAARSARYRALGEWALGCGASALATAHHRDDQAETVLMRMLRGAGVAGLRGIQDRRPLGDGPQLVRPLLGWSKAELVAVVADAGIVPVDDPSNRDPRYDRTHARRLLAEGWADPERLATVARNMRDAEEALAHSAARLFADRWQEGAGDTGRLAAADLPREYRRRLLVTALKRRAPEAILRGDEVDRLLDRLVAGEVSTLAGQRIQPGPVWLFSTAPPRRSA